MDKQMNIDNLDVLLKQLLAEYEQSGLDMDAFMEQKLKSIGREDAADVVKDINDTLEHIDTKYEALQKFKDNGGNREEWLRQEMDDATEGIPSDKAGKALSSATKILNGESTGDPDEDANYDALDAAIMIRDLDDAISRNTCQSLKPVEEK